MQNRGETVDMAGCCPIEVCQIENAEAAHSCQRMACLECPIKSQTLKVCLICFKNTSMPQWQRVELTDTGRGPRHRAGYTPGAYAGACGKNMVAQVVLGARDPECTPFAQMEKIGKMHVRQSLNHRSRLSREQRRHEKRCLEIQPLQQLQDSF